MAQRIDTHTLPSWLCTSSSHGEIQRNGDRHSPKYQCLRVEYRSEAEESTSHKGKYDLRNQVSSSPRAVRCSCFMCEGFKLVSQIGMPLAETFILSTSRTGRAQCYATFLDLTGRPDRSLGGVHVLACLGFACSLICEMLFSLSLFTACFADLFLTLGKALLPMCDVIAE